MVKKVRALIDQIWQFVRRNPWIVIFFVLLLGIFLANAVHETFPDEYDNILGGFYIDNGRLPLIGFFTHHNIGAYFLAAVNTIFTGRSFVAFRILSNLEMYIAVVGTYVMFRKSFGVKRAVFYLLYALILAVGSTYWWGEMFLSETLVSYLLIPVYGLLVLKLFYGQVIKRWELILVSILLFVAFSVSLTYVFMFLVIYPLAWILYVKQFGRFNLRRWIEGALILGLPYLVFGVYLVVTGSLTEFYYQQYVYNFNYYIYNFPTAGGVRTTNGIRYAASIAYNTFGQLYRVLLQVKDLNLEYPFNVALVMCNVALMVYLATKKRLGILIFVFMTILFANARSEPLNIKETDFHATLFIVLSFFNLAWVLFESYKDLNGRAMSAVGRALVGVVLGVTLLYASFAGLLLTNKFLEKGYGKFSGSQALIYDRPDVAPILNKITTPNDYVWVGPFAFHELLYTTGKVPSKYGWFLPQGEAFSRFKDGLISDLTVNRPKVIVFEKGYTVFGKQAEEWNYPVVNFLNTNYFSFEDLSKLGYVSKAGKTEHFDFTQTYYFDNNRRDEIIADLVRTGLIEKVK